MKPGPNGEYRYTTVVAANASIHLATQAAQLLGLAAAMRMGGNEAVADLLEDVAETLRLVAEPPCENGLVLSCVDDDVDALGYKIVGKLGDGEVLAADDKKESN